MAKSENRRQKQLARRKARRASKQREIRRGQSQGIRARLYDARHAPIRDSFMAQSIHDRGLGIVLISRDLDDEIAFATFLVDIYCLGVKDAMARIEPRSRYREFVDRMREGDECNDINPATARRLVEDAVEYARNLGFSPHQDYSKAREIFGEIDPDEAEERFQMGKDGKPFYIAGPHESTHRILQIINRLRAACGTGGFHYFATVDEAHIPADARVVAVEDETGLHFIDESQEIIDEPHDD